MTNLRDTNTTGNIISKTVDIQLTREGNLIRYGVTKGSIVRIDIETYLKGVVPAEIGNSTLEACKAQAVAARTFALGRMKSRGYLPDTTDAQAYAAAYNDVSRYPNCIHAVEETRGQVLSYNGTVLPDCQYGASNKGQTKGYRNKPYYQEKPDPWDQAEREYRTSRGERLRVGNRIGLSQYGARYASRNGIGYREILDFYYTGAVIVKDYGTTIDRKEDESRVRNTWPDRQLSQKEKDTVSYAERQVGQGYVWGSVGQTLTEATLAALLKRHGQHINEDIVRKWMGKKVFDCAGLLTSIFSNYLRTRVVSGVSSQWKGNYWEIKGTIDTLPKNYVVMLYHASPDANPMSHGGLYCGNGMVVDARGSRSGVVRSKLESYPWTHWALPKGLLPAEDVNIIKRIVGNNIGNNTGGNTENMKAIVTGNKLALRSQMSTAASTLITRVNTGTSVDILEKVNNTWWRVSYGGIVGYMMAQYLTESTPAPSTPPDTGGAESGQDEVEDNQYAVHILCKTKEEAERVLKLLKTAVLT